MGSRSIRRPRRVPRGQRLTMTVINMERHGSVEVRREVARAFHEMRDPSAMYSGNGHHRALQGLAEVATCGRSGVGLLTGPPGLGKTLVRSALHQFASGQNCTVVSLETALLGFDDVLLEILSQVRNERILPGDLPSRYERLSELKSVLVSKVLSEGKHLLLLVDDAEQMTTETLDAIGALNNLCSENKSFVVPILFGHDTMRQKLKQSPALHQRIGAHFTLAPLGLADCRAYIAHRLAAVGCKEEQVFAPGAVERIQVVSGGVPRVINALCRQAIAHASHHGDTLVTPAVVDECRGLLPELGATISAFQLGR